MRVVSRVQMLTSAANAPIITAALDDRRVQIWDLNTGEQIAQFNTVLEGGGRRLAVNPTGGICVAASWKKGKRDGVACYDVRSNQIKWHRPDIRRIQGLRFSVAGDGIWCEIEGGSVQRLDAESGSTQGSVSGVEDVYESPYSDQRLEIRGPALWVKGEKEFQVSRQSFALLDAVFGPDTLCLTEASGSVRCLECVTGKERWRFQPALWTHVVALSYRASDDSFLRRSAHR
jgi:WD40 repeat protein